ncbi:hypothetical protein JZ751_029853 [Albula glossodonta]|uniref:Telomeric repeat-binding factor 2-interacting protein 1 n=1 Tax=Albula glossodonta TaxID=121402 RepID=A0A8T2N9R2_9TELE|nr:hypothetical protein JZ751_029853 [Albula glossodonta]
MSATDGRSSPLSRVLFLSETGEPMRFYLRPGPTKTQLQPIIKAGGGVVCAAQESRAILLMDPEDLAELPSRMAHWYVSTEYVRECAERNQQLEVEDYRFKSEDAPQRAAKRKKASGNSGRMGYTAEEDATILRFVRRRANEVGGNRVWQEMEQQAVTSHSWQSMKDRYRKHLTKQRVEEAEGVEHSTGEKEGLLEKFFDKPSQGKEADLPPSPKKAKLSVGTDQPPSAEPPAPEHPPETSPEGTRPQCSPGKGLAESSPERTHPHRSPGKGLAESSPERTHPQCSPGKGLAESSPERTRPQRSPGKTQAESSPDRTRPQRSPGKTQAESSPDRTRPQRLPGKGLAESSPERTHPRRSPGKTQAESSPEKTHPQCSPGRAEAESSPERTRPHRSPGETCQTASPEIPHQTPSPERPRPVSSPKESPEKTGPKASSKMTVPALLLDETAPPASPETTQPQPLAGGSNYEDMEEAGPSSEVIERKKQSVVAEEAEEREDEQISVPKKRKLGILERAVKEFEESDESDDDDETPDIALSSTRSADPGVRGERVPALTSAEAVPVNSSSDKSINNNKDSNKDRDSNSGPRTEPLVMPQAVAQSEGPVVQHGDLVSTTSPKDNGPAKGSAVPLASDVHMFLFDQDSQEDEEEVSQHTGNPSYSQAQLEEAKELLRDLMAQSKRSLADVTKSLLKNSGDVAAALQYLQSGRVPQSSGRLWDPRDDGLLQSADASRHGELVQKYGKVAVAKRMAFLDVE